MPVLSPETGLYPETLLDGFSEEPSGRRWWAIYTRARQEKALARDLLRYEIPFYLPLVKKTTLYGRRRISACLPLFSGYVFLFGSEDERVHAWTTNRISRVLTVGTPGQFREDLRQIHRLILSNAPLTVESRLAPGRRVRVQYGSLAGLEGTVVTRRGGTRLVVRVDFLQQGASVEIDDFMLEPVD